MTDRVAFGDWQTPLDLARAALARVAKDLEEPPRTVVEPSCGTGAFLVAAREVFDAPLLGFEIKPEYAAVARARLPPSARVQVADFFDVPWERELALPDPILLVGNPPWVTSATLGALGSRNLPAKSNFKGLSGYDAMTGKSNFDVSEWMILRLLDALRGRRATLALLCKTAVARRVVEHAVSRQMEVRPGGLWRFDTKRYFHASVDAVLFVAKTGRGAGAAWPIHDSFDAVRPTSTLAVVGGVLSADAGALERTVHLAGRSDPEWRSGLKHDCSKVMELTRRGTDWVNGFGESVDVERVHVFPFLKSSDVARGEPRKERAVLVPQRNIGEETAGLRETAPRLWAYLSSHRSALAGRKSRIYRGRPDFAIFGIGAYSFARWKVAISGLYKRSTFTVVGPVGGRPVMLDDTCYFLPFDSQAEAERAHRALMSKPAQDFFSSRVFWDAKRPVNKAVLQSLDLRALVADLDRSAGRSRRNPQRRAV